MPEVEAVRVPLPATPYRGINSFLYSDHPIFFARATETRALLRHIVVYRGVLLYGETGAGKSSLVNAGMFSAAALEGLRPDRIRVQPRLGEELVVERIPITAEPDSEFLPSSFADALDRSPRVVLPTETFADRLRELPEGVRPLLVFDQFEELVTLFEEARAGDAVADGTAAQTAQRRVVDLLAELLRDGRLPVKLLFVFREDYLAKVRKLLAARPELMDQSLRLTPPSSDALGEIVRGPFERHPARFDHELSPQLSERLIAAIETRAGSGEINLSEVQVVCLRLWSASDPESLFEAKGVAGLLEDYLRTALDAFSEELRFPAIALLSQMVTPSGARNVVSAEDLVGRVQADEEIDRGLLERALAELEDKTRLVRRERRRDLYLYEITSEFLVPWIRARQQESIREREREKLAEAEAQRARERKNRAFRISAVILLLLVGVLVAATIVAVSQQRHAMRLEGIAVRLAAVAQSRQREATRLERVARSLHLADVASGEVGIEPIRALRTAALAEHVKATPEAAGALEAALATTPARAILSGDHNPHDVVFSPNGVFIVTAGDDGDIRLWQAATGRMLATLPSGAHRVIRVAFSRNGKRIVAAAQDGSARVWDLASKRVIASLLPLHRYSPGNYDLGPIFVPFPSVEFNRNGSLVLAVALDGAVRVWDVTTRRVLLERRGNEHRVINSASFSPNGALFVTASDDGTAKIWNVDTRRVTRVFHVGEQVARAAFTHDGRHVLTADAYGTVRVWATSTGRRSTAMSPSNTLNVNTSKYTISTVFSPDGRSAFTVLPDGKPRLWDVAARRLIELGAGQRVVSAAFSPDSALLITTRSDGSAQLWDAHTGELSEVLSGPSGRKGERERKRRLHAANFTPDSRRVVVTSAGGATTYVVRRSVGRLRRIRGAGSGVTSADLSPANGSLVAVSAGRAMLQQLNGTHRSTALPAGSGPVNDATLSPDGTFAVTRSKNGVRIWHAGTGRTVMLLPASVGAVAFSPQGRRILIGRGSDAVVRTNGNREPLVLATAAKSVDAAAFSTDGSLIAVAGSDGTTRIFDAATGNAIRSIRVGDADRVESVRFSDDGKRVVTATASGTAVVWTTHGKKVWTLRGHSAKVIAAVFSPDPSGRLVLTTSADGTARLWDMNTGSTCAVFGDGVTPIRTAEFDGTDRIITLDARGIVRTETPGLCAAAVSGALPAVARRIVRPLTARDRDALLHTTR